MKKLIYAVALALGLGMPLVACDVDHQERATSDGRSAHEVSVSVDKDVVEDTRAAGRNIKEAGKDLGRVAKRGVNEVRENIPDVDVDVDVKSRESSDKPGN